MPTCDIWGKSDLLKVVKGYQAENPTSKGSEVILNLNRVVLMLIEKVEVLEATTVALMTKKSLIDKFLLDIKKQGNKMQEE